MSTELAIAGEPRTDVDLDALIAALDGGVDELPEEALRTCQAHRELVTPRLIDVLAEAVRLGRAGTVREGNAHFFALFLLTEFEAKEALPVILELYALPDPVLDGLLDDVITESTRRVLAVLAADQPDQIEALIGNRQINEYVRWEAAAAFCNLLRDGRMPREEAIRRLAGQLRTAIADEDVWGVTITVNELGDLNPLEVQEEIKAAYDRELVDETVIDWSNFEEGLLDPEHPGTCPELDNEPPSAVADTVEVLRGWYCFSEEYRDEKRAYEARQAERSAPHWLDEDEEDYEDDIDDHGASPIPTEWAPTPPLTIRNEAPRIGRNDPCPCGSGKKHKKCCLRAGGEF